MLVYGDVVRTVDAAALAETVADGLDSFSQQEPGIGRHEALRRTFLEAADLLTGLVDRDFEQAGSDGVSEWARAMTALTEIAAALGRSWDSGFAELPDVSSAARTLRELGAAGSIRVKPMEGYSFYALYPESYWVAAKRSELPAETRVIGIRSIGTGLAAMVAAALSAEPPVTVRPVGHPFARELRVNEGWEKQVFAAAPETYAIADEGPGLSGSSFGAVADWLEARGGTPEKIHFFASHNNALGPEAREEHRQRWSAAHRHFVAADELLLGPERRLQGWVEGLVGPLDEPLEEITGGGWRRLLRGGEELPVEGWWERRKFLAVKGGERFLVKFTGLSSEDEGKLKTAKLLAREGFGTEPIGTVGGFLVERWSEAPNLATVWVERKTLLRELGRYLRFRATLAAEPVGASLVTLREMAVYNTEQGIGAEASAAVAARLQDIQALQGKVRPVYVDSRMQRWEWLVDEGRLIKTDALDHARTHDFVGPQDIAWDVAGTIVEHGLNGMEALELTSEVGADAGLVDALLPCYLAFQLGAWTMANGSDDPEARRYREALGRLLTS